VLPELAHGNGSLCSGKSTANEHCSEEVEALREGICTENGKAANNGCKCVDMAQHTQNRVFLHFVNGDNAEVFEHQQCTIEQSPDHKGSSCAMPQTCEKEHDPLVEDGTRLPLAVAAKGDVEVFLEPCRNGNMPSSPEFCDTCGDVGVVEILLECEAEHMPQTDCHITVAGEIEINLQGVANRAHPCQRQNQFITFHCKNAVHDHADSIGNEYFFGKTAEKTADALCDFRQVHGTFCQLCFDVLVLDDRACDQLRKADDVERELCKIFLYGNIPPIHVNDVGHCLKGEKGNADGQCNVRHRNVHKGEQIERFREKSGIFEYAEHSEIDDNGRNQPDVPQPFPPVHEPAEQVIPENGKEHQKDHERFTERIECKACQNQQPIAQVAMRQNAV